MAPSHIRAVIFDCDGVLADSEPMHDSATREELRQRGISVPDSFFHDHIGMRVGDQMAVLAERYGIDRGQLLNSRERRFWAMAAEGFQEVPGSAATVRALHAVGLKIAVSTSGSRKWIDHVITELGLTKEISASICGADVDEPKPHPRSYLAAAESIDVPAAECGVIEDSQRGFHSAVAAGCVVVVLDRDGRDPHQFRGAAAITTSMSQARDYLLGIARIDAHT